MYCVSHETTPRIFYEPNFHPSEGNLTEHLHYSNHLLLDSVQLLPYRCHSFQAYNVLITKEV